MSKAAGTAKDLAKTARDRQNQPKMTLGQQLEKMIPEMAKIIPRHIDERMVARTIMTEIRKNPKLGQCEPSSFLAAVMDATQMGLTPGPLGHIYFIPYGKECSLQLGYKGILELVYRSDRIETVYAYPVFEGDTFKATLGLTPNVIHEPCGESDPKKLTHVYAVAYIRGNQTARIEVMSRQQVDDIMKRSQAAQKGSSPWKTDYAEMARKTVLKRICKQLPLSTELQTHINSEERVRRLKIEEETLQVEDYGSVYDSGGTDGEDKNADDPPAGVDVETGEITDAKNVDNPVDKDGGEVEPDEGLFR